MYDHKFQNKSGYPTFWNSLKDGVVLKDDHCDVPEVRNQTVVDPLLQYKNPAKRVECSNVSLF